MTVIADHHHHDTNDEKQETGSLPQADHPLIVCLGIQVKSVVKSQEDKFEEHQVEEQLKRKEKINTNELQMNLR